MALIGDHGHPFRELATHDFGHATVTDAGLDRQGSGVAAFENSRWCAPGAVFSSVVVFVPVRRGGRGIIFDRMLLEAAWVGRCWLWA
ncbi:MAG: hypothetical protein R3E42_06015 [Burkholderiaceae bacterium]